MCGAMVNGQTHGPQRATTLCQPYMRHFKDGELIVAEPWRCRAFPVIKDLVVDRSVLDLIIQEGGYTSVRTGQAPDAHSFLVEREKADMATHACRKDTLWSLRGCMSQCFCRVIYRGENQPVCPASAGGAGEEKESQKHGVEDGRIGFWELLK